MTESMPTKSRLLRTGTLVLIAVVLLIGGGVLMVWQPYRKYHRGQRATSVIERLGGDVVTEVFPPSWMPDSVDDEYLSVFGRVTQIRLTGAQISPAEFEHLEGLADLEILSLTNTRVSDAGLVYLRGFTNLQNLSLNGTQVSDVGLESLQGLANL
ncbi:Leucine Rich repeats (2 copies) [Symmachiella dynata]|uniref:hypothetical protein n=1 Tax=Symmachiella dynata TaxID=2527995 RepID=UPI00118ADB9D|nr:hypothetical protein [Symmachiella dynata]QDT48897.1 Leucine Rich repeats (2 copies) [Symmachiella dynata]